MRCQGPAGVHSKHDAVRKHAGHERSSWQAMHAPRYTLAGGDDAARIDCFRLNICTVKQAIPVAKGSLPRERSVYGMRQERRDSMPHGPAATKRGGMRAHLPEGWADAGAKRTHLEATLKSAIRRPPDALVGRWRRVRSVCKPRRTGASGRRGRSGASTSTSGESAVGLASPQAVTGTTASTAASPSSTMEMKEVQYGKYSNGRRGVYSSGPTLSSDRVAIIN